MRSPIKIKHAIKPLGEMSVLEESALTKQEIFYGTLDFEMFAINAVKI